MKKPIIIIIAFLFCTIAFAQDYSLIEKAEKKIDQKEYQKALKLLKKAEKADYGFCGNAYMDAKSRIDELKMRLFKESNNDVEMYKFLNSIDPFLENNTYSIERIRLALKVYSKPELNAKIIGALKNFKKEDYNAIDEFNTLTLKIDDNLKLRLAFKDIFGLSKLDAPAYNEALMKIYTDSEYYKLLTQ